MNLLALSIDLWGLERTLFTGDKTCFMVLFCDSVRAQIVKSGLLVWNKTTAWLQGWTCQHGVLAFETWGSQCPLSPQLPGSKVRSWSLAGPASMESWHLSHDGPCVPCLRSRLAPRWGAGSLLDLPAWSPCIWVVRVPVPLVSAVAWLQGEELDLCGLLLTAVMMCRG